MTDLSSMLASSVTEQEEKLHGLDASEGELGRSVDVLITFRFSLLQPLTPSFWIPILSREG